MNPPNLATPSQMVNGLRNFLGNNEMMGAPQSMAQPMDQYMGQPMGQPMMSNDNLVSNLRNLIN